MVWAYQIYTVICYHSDPLPVKVGVTKARYKCVSEYFDSIMNCGRDRYIQVSEQIEVLFLYDGSFDFSTF